MKVGLRFFALMLLALVGFDAAAQAQNASLGKGFLASSFNSGGTTTLIFVVVNPAGNPLQTVSFTDTLPTGLRIATPPAGSSTCGNVNATPVAGATSVTIVAADVPAGGAGGSNCTLQLDVTNAQGQTGSCPAVAFTNSSTNITGLSANLTNAVQSSCVSVVGVQQQNATITKAFNPTSITAGGTSTLTFTITNPANNPAQAFGFTDTLPAGLVIAAVPNPQSNCTNLTGQNPVAGGNQIIINPTATVGAGTATPTTCTFSVVVTNAAAVTGTCPAVNLTNTSTSLTGLTTNLTNGVTAQCLTVNAVTAPPPALTKAFNPTSIAAGATSVLTFTLTNPAGSPAVSNVSFTDNLPTNLRVAATPGVGGTCANAAAATTAAAGATSIAIASLQVPVGASSCTVTVNVTNAAGQVGTCPNVAFTNTANSITGVANVTNSVVSGCLTVTQQPATLTKSFSPATINNGGTSTLTFTITNPASNNPAQIVSFTDTLPTGLRIAAAPNQGGTCGSLAGTAPAGGTAIAVTAATVAASTATQSTCTITVDVTNAAGQTNASCGTNPVAFTNGTGNISGLATNLTNNVQSSCLVVNSNTFSITKTPSSNLLTPNSPLSYTIVVTNNGPSAANGATLTDPVIGGFSATGVSCTTTTGGAACPGTVTLGALQSVGGIALTTFPANSSITFVLSGTFTGTGVTVNTATVTSPPGAAAPVSASAAATVAVNSPAANIPTLAEQALIALALLLAFAGAYYVRRTQR